MTFPIGDPASRASDPRAASNTSLFAVPQEKPVAEFNNPVQALVQQSLAADATPLGLGESLDFAVLSSENPSDCVLKHARETLALGAGAHLKRRIRFALGRAAAHIALEKVGMENSAGILRGVDGEPLWPHGIVGSITHCYPWSVAVVAKSSTLAIGIDLESVQRIHGPDISRLICRDSELRWVRDGHFHERVAMIFSAKEAIYKAVYPLYQRYIDFTDVELSWHADPACFYGQLMLAAEPGTHTAHLIKVYCRSRWGYVFSLVLQELE